MMEAYSPKWLQRDLDPGKARKKNDISIVISV